MRRGTVAKAGLVLAAAIAATACVACRKAPASPPGAERLSESGRYRLEASSDETPVPLNRLHAWTVRIQTIDRTPVTDAVVTIDGGMPEHRHGLPTRPEVTGHVGDGRYRVEGMKFNMPGRWVLTVTFWVGPLQDRASFEMVLP